MIGGFPDAKMIFTKSTYQQLLARILILAYLAGSFYRPVLDGGHFLSHLIIGDGFLQHKHTVEHEGFGKNHPILGGMAKVFSDQDEAPEHEKLVKVIDKKYPEILNAGMVFPRQWKECICIMHKPLCCEDSTIKVIDPPPEISLL